MKRFLHILALVLLATLLTLNCGGDKFEQPRRLIDKGLYEEAANQLQQTIEKNPEDQEAFYLLGIALSHLTKTIKDREKAVEAFKKSILLNPRHANSFFALGVLEGRSYLDTVLSIDPQHEGALWLASSGSVEYFQRLMKVRPIDKTSFKPHFVEDKQRNSSAFIVLADSTPLYTVEDNAIVGWCGRLEMKGFIRHVNDRYVFINRIPIWKQAEGWIFDRHSSDRQAQTNKPLESVRIYSHVASNADPREPGFTECMLSWRWLQPGEERPLPRNVAGRTVNKNDIRVGTIRLNGKTMGCDVKERVSYFLFSGVTFDQVDSYREETLSVLEKDCTPSLGDVDRDRIAIIKSRPFWPKNLCNNILRGQISKGMTVEMVMAALGRDGRRAVMDLELFPEGLRREVKFPDVELKFVNGRLREWKSFNNP